MSIHPMLTQRGDDFSDVEEKIRNLQHAAYLFEFVTTISVAAANVRVHPELDDLRGVAWLAETIKGMSDDLHATLFPKNGG
jgi:hypothetical protein